MFHEAKRKMNVTVQDIYVIINNREDISRKLLPGFLRNYDPSMSDSVKIPGDRRKKEFSNFNYQRVLY